MLSGWGRTGGTRARVTGPMEVDALSALLQSRPPRGLLARGCGRSYGDAAQNAGGLVLAPVTGRHIEVDAAGATVRASGSTTFVDLLARLVPQGLLLPVLPGTGHLTVGGAVAADVHGKNQRVDGSIASWLESVEVVGGDGRRRVLGPDRDARGFRATVGGMGLTGVITAVTLRLLRIRSARMDVTVRRADTLDELMAGLDAATSRYTVAWVDSTAGGRALGRGVLDLGDHRPDLDSATEPHGLQYLVSRSVEAPQLPFTPVNGLTSRAFNGVWFRKAPREAHATAGLSQFFHRLDAVSGWNRSLGPRGLLQYQLVVPTAAAHLVADVLHALQRADSAPFMATLKRFGPGNGHPLSFPLPGWSLAVDLPANRPHVARALDDLDRRVAHAGGRLYLAKDARLGRSCFEDMYGPLEQWHAARADLDPDGVLRSDLGRRLGLCR